MRPHHCAGALPIQVQIADVKRLFGFLDFFRILRVHRAGQSKLRIVRNFQRLVVIFRLDHRQHRAKHFFLRQPRMRIHIGNNRRLEEEAVTGSSLPARQQLPFFLSDFDVIQNRFHRRLADHWPHVIRRIVAWANRDFLRALHQLLHKRVVNFFGNDHARTRRTFLPLIAKRRLRRAFHCRVDISFVVHHDAVLAAHLQHRALDPDLPRHGFARKLADAQPYFLRARESDVARLGVLHQRVAKGPARAGDEIHRFLWNARLKKNVNEFCRDRWRITCGLEHHRVSGDQRSRSDSRHDGARKIPRWNHYAHAQRNINKVVALAAHRNQLLRLAQAQHFPPVEFQKVDRFRDVRIRFRPGLADFVAHQRVQLILPLADDVCRTEKAFRALLRRNALPRVKVFVRVFDRLPRHLRRGILENADDFHRMRRIRGGALLRGGHLLPVEPHRVLTAKLRLHLFQRLLHPRAVLRLRKIDKRLVGELGNVDNLFGSSHGGFPPRRANIYSTAPANYPTSEGRGWSSQCNHSLADDSRNAHLRRYSLGATPISRLKTRLKELSDPYPTDDATSENDAPFERIMSPARCIRHCVRYSRGVWPKTVLNFKANADLDILASRASDSTDQFFSSPERIACIALLRCLSDMADNHPFCGAAELLA